MNTIFITGVDTDIGKTFVSIGLCLSLESKGKRVGYFKPFQSGAYKKDGFLIAPDLFELKKYSNIESKYSYLFEGEVSPHLASILSNVTVDVEKVKKDLSDFSSSKDFVVIEGAGGFYCPAVKGKLFSDIIKSLNQKIIIVTTPALGRLNHLLMTLECAKACGVEVLGIIINKMPKNKTLSEENFIKEFKMFSDAKILGVIPEMLDPSKEEIVEAFQNINL